MRAGDRRHRIELQKQMAGKNDLGEALPAQWVTIEGGAVWARRIELQAARLESFTGSELIAEAQVAWEILFSADVAGVDAQHAVLDPQGKRWDVLHVADARERGELRILTKARVD